MTAQLGLGLAALGRPGYIPIGHGRDLGATAPAAMEPRCHAASSAEVRRDLRAV